MSFLLHLPTPLQFLIIPLGRVSVCAGIRAYMFVCVCLNVICITSCVFHNSCCCALPVCVWLSVWVFVGFKWVSVCDEGLLPLLVPTLKENLELWWCLVKSSTPMLHSLGIRTKILEQKVQFLMVSSLSFISLYSFSTFHHIGGRGWRCHNSTRS